MNTRRLAVDGRESDISTDTFLFSTEHLHASFIRYEMLCRFSQSVVTNLGEHTEIKCAHCGISYYYNSVFVKLKPNVD